MLVFNVTTPNVTLLPSLDASRPEQTDNDVCLFLLAMSSAAISGVSLFPCTFDFFYTINDPYGRFSILLLMVGNQKWQAAYGT
jgi:hypothetical protein